MPKIKYIALLRGINIGPHKKIKMAELRESLVKINFTNTKTILASGNVVFETDQPKNKLPELISNLIKKNFGHDVPVIIRPFTEITELVNSDPFKKIKVTKQTRLYITFLPEPHQSKLKLSKIDSSFEIIKINPTEILSVLTLSPTSGTIDAMKILEQEFGKNITTRNWNTIIKITNTTCHTQTNLT